MALVCKSLGDVPTGVATPAEISRGDSTLQVHGRFRGRAGHSEDDSEWLLRRMRCR